MRRSSSKKKKKKKGLRAFLFLFQKKKLSLHLTTQVSKGALSPTAD